MPNYIFLINGLSIVLFLVSSVVFFFGWKKKQFNSAFLVSAITTVSYTFMLQLGSAPYIRWIGYAISCTLLAWVMAEYLHLSQDSKRTLMFVTPFVMITGAFASLSTGFFMLVWFVLGGLFYVVMVRTLMASQNFKKVSKYIWFGWSVFPLIFILSPEGFGVVPMMYAMIAYLILDIYTKIIFYKTINKKTQD